MTESSFFQYWLRVAKQATREASKTLGCFGRYITIILSVAAPFIGSLLTGSSPTAALVNAIVTASFVLAIWLLFFIVKVAQQPVIIHNGQISKLNELSAELATTKHSQPNLVITKVQKDIRGWNQLPNARYSAEFFHVKFANRLKTHTKDATGQKVVALLTYCDAQERLFEQIYGRWSSTKEPTELPRGSNDLSILDVSFDANGVEQELTVALRHPNDDVIYAFNNSSYNHPAYKNPDFLIDRKIIYIHVLLMGENVNDTHFWLRLENSQGDWTITVAAPPELLRQRILPS